MSMQYTASGLKKSRTSDECQELNLLQETLKCIEELFNLRLADRISRPRDADWKQNEINLFGKKMQGLHQKMYRIRSQLADNYPSDSLNRNKSAIATATNFAQVDWKKYVKLIQLRYNEVLVDGSFKHCRRICELLELKYLTCMEIIDVQAWADDCLQSKQVEKCCCC